MKKLTLITLTILLVQLFSFSQDVENCVSFKKEITEYEKIHLRKTFENILETDQKYRAILSANTLDQEILDYVASIDDPGKVFKVIDSLNLTLDPIVEDSLRNLVGQIDFQNHLILRGIFDRYGYLTKDIVGDLDYLQLLLLVHLPSEEDSYKEVAEEYSAVMLKEVIAGRMPAKEYATFYDNAYCKVLRLPQLYGTNLRCDPKTYEILPPIIRDIEETNSARKKIGLDPLLEDEYELSK